MMRRVRSMTPTLDRDAGLLPVSRAGSPVLGQKKQRGLATNIAYGSAALAVLYVLYVMTRMGAAHHARVRDEAAARAAHEWHGDHHGGAHDWHHHGGDDHHLSGHDWEDHGAAWDSHHNLHHQQQQHADHGHEHDAHWREWQQQHDQHQQQQEHHEWHARGAAGSDHAAPPQQHDQHQQQHAGHHHDPHAHAPADAAGHHHDPHAAHHDWDWEHTFKPYMDDSVDLHHAAQQHGHHEQQQQHHDAHAHAQQQHHVAHAQHQQQQHHDAHARQQQQQHDAHAHAQQQQQQHQQQQQPHGGGHHPPAAPEGWVVEDTPLPDPAAAARHGHGHAQQQQQHHEQHYLHHPDHATPQGLYTLSAVDIDGRTHQLSEFAGRVTLVVNVASRCGYTDENYRGLQSVYEKYRAHGLEILAFPSNEFGGQEPGARDQIRDFARNAYHATFPVFDKVSVNGAGAHPVWRYLRRELPEAQGGGGGKADGRDLPWNFQKILVDQRGRPVKLLGAPWDQAEVENAVYDLLLAGEAEYEAWAAQHQQQHSQQQHSQQQHH